MGVQWKTWFLGGTVHKKPIYRGNCLKRGAWTVCKFKGGLDKKERGGVFKGGWYPTAHYENPFVSTRKKSIWLSQKF